MLEQDIILINRSFIKSKNVTERKIDKNEKRSKVKIFSIPSILLGITENNTTTINSLTIYLRPNTLYKYETSR